ncbi:MAG: hypothetical protein EOP00_15235 [Pedobacter sp.]|nr:MAG: hypothetical protein EOP00_15235 [Pedobacter sp.]
MENVFGVLLLVSIVMFVLGLISPMVSLFWYKQKQSRKMSSLIYGLSIIACFILFGIVAPKNTVTSEKPASGDIQTSTTDKKELTQEQKDSIGNEKKQQEVEERKRITFTPTYLVSEYTQNEINADNNFKGKYFYVVGYIDHIGKDIMDDSYVTLKSGDVIRTVQCFIDDQDILANLRKNQKVTIYGQCDGLMMNVIMKDCQVTNDLP